MKLRILLHGSSTRDGQVAGGRTGGRAWGGVAGRGNPGGEFGGERKVEGFGSGRRRTVEGMRETSPEMGWWRNPGEEGCGEGGGDGGAAVRRRRRRRLEDCGVAKRTVKYPWPGQGVAAVVAAAAVGLLPRPSLSSHLRGRVLLSFFK